MSDDASKNSIGLRLAMVGFLTLILLVPATIVGFLVGEREQRQEEAVKEVGSKWGNTQTITGPIISVPYKANKDTKVAYFLPVELNISGDIDPQILKRGIYEITAYNSKLKIAGQFIHPNFSQLGVSGSNVLWNEAKILVGLSDMRGVNEKISLNWNDRILALNPGMSAPQIADSGVSVIAPLGAETYKFSFDLNLNGSQSLNFIPLGKETNVNLSSQWANPSFDGAFLPDQREVSKDGFTAQWKILSLNRNYPQSFNDSDRYNLRESGFGVKFLVPVDQYQKTTRSIKYAIMFIALTFLTFFFVEIFNKKRIHPIQYLLVGFALLVFYTLLLSISEHTDFNIAYSISSLATIILIVLYSMSIFKNRILTLALGGILVILYGFMYVVLQLQDYALLMGSIGLFLVLAAVMFISRKIDWYSFSFTAKN